MALELESRSRQIVRKCIRLGHGSRRSEASLLSTFYVSESSDLTVADVVLGRVDLYLYIVLRRVAAQSSTVSSAGSPAERAGGCSHCIKYVLKVLKNTSTPNPMSQAQQGIG